MSRETVYPFKDKQLVIASLKSNTLHSEYTSYRLHTMEQFVQVF
jgi:hypothetical protein